MRRTRGLWPAAVSGGLVVVLAVWVAVAGRLPGELRVLIEVHDAGPAERPLRAVSDLSELVPLVVVAAMVLVVLLALRRWTDAAYFAAGVAVVWAVNPLLKELVGRPRPELWPLPASVSEYSFPSGHAANTAALVGGLLLVLPSGRWRVTGASVGVAALVLVGISQLVLGRHYPTDVVAGWLWAVAWIVVVRWFRRWNARRAAP